MAATVDICLAGASGRSVNGTNMPVPDAVPIDTDVIVASASPQQTDFSVPVGATGLFWIVSAIGGNIRIKFGDNPAASAAEGGGWLILDGRTGYWAASPGQKGSVITAEV